MYLLTQCKLIADFFLNNKDFYNRTAITQALADIAGACDYEDARAKLFILSENLQVVIKFVLGFLKYDVFKEVCDDPGMLDFNMPNKPFLAESHMQNSGAGNEVLLFFKVPDIETYEDKKLREEQMQIIMKFVAMDTFKENAAKLGCKLNFPRKKSYEDELVQISANLKSFFYILQSIRRFAVLSVKLPADYHSSDKEQDAIINAAKDNVLTCLEKMGLTAEALKQRLDLSSRPEKLTTSTYFYRLQLVNEEIHEFSRQVKVLLPNNKIMMIASEQLRDDNIFPALKQIIDGYKNSMAFIFNFVNELPKINKKANAHLKQKIKNVKRFNQHYPPLIKELLFALSALDAAFPIAFKLLPDLTPATSDNIGCKLMVIARDITLAQLPYHAGIDIKLINDDVLLLAHAEIAISIITLAQHLKNVLDDFNSTKSIAKDPATEIEDLLAKMDSEKYLLLHSYESLIGKIQGNKFNFEKNTKFVHVQTQVYESVLPGIWHLKNMVFDIVLDNAEQVRLLMSAIKSLSDKIADTQILTTAFINLLPILKHTGNTLKENHTQFTLILKTLTQNLVTLKNAYQKLLGKVVLADQKERVTDLWLQITELEVSINAAVKVFSPLSQTDDSNLFQMVTGNMLTLKTCIKTAEAKAEKIQAALDEENCLLDKASLALPGFATNPNRLQFNPVPFESKTREELDHGGFMLAACSK
jgi:hypothetical protein